MSSFLVQHIRSGEYGKRPKPLDLSAGQLAVNYNSSSPGLFFRSDSGELLKVGPTHVGTSAPYQTNHTDRSLGEMWLDTTVPTGPSLRVYTNNGWSVVNVLDGSITTDKIENGAVDASKITLNNTLIPTGDGLYDLGSTGRKFSAIYSNNIKSAQVDLVNSLGNWSLSAAANYVILTDNSSGQQYRITMEPIS